MKLFIWDFHGVLEKGNDSLVLEITNRILENHGYLRRMTKQEGEFLSGRLWSDYFAYLIPELTDGQRLALQSACFEMSENFQEKFGRYVELNDHAIHVLEAIESSKNIQILISNTQPTILNTYVKVVGIEKYFPLSHRFGVDALVQNRKTKKECLHEFLNASQNIDEIISIGDSSGDMDLINVSSLKGTGYLYSYPSRPHRLIQCHYKINDLRVVLQEIAERNLT